MNSYEQILLFNRGWAKSKTEVDKDFLKRLSQGQNPEYLWIGCSDSRVPAEEITGVNPGDFFVYRNVANLAKADDPSFISVLKYAVDFLKVKHIVVCGHYGCGGVKAAIDNLQDEHITPWVAEIRQTYLENKENIDKHIKDEHKANNLSELNVFKQVNDVISNPIVKNAWKRGQDLSVHGWIFSIETGEIDSLKEVLFRELPPELK